MERPKPPRHYFPGRERPGLIEASSERGRAACSGPFPGRERPGLIEASVLPHHPLRRSAFQGASALASLKRVGRADNSRAAASAFQGASALASLKQRSE